MIRLSTLGGLDLRGSDGPAIRAVLAQPKRFALLTYLAVANSHSFRRRDSVVALFWPELDQERARNALRQALWFLRRSLGEGVIVGRSEEELGVDPATLRCDATEFEHACSAGHPAEALELYRGEFLEGFFVSEAEPELEHWIEEERAHLHRLAAEAAWAVAQQNRLAGDHTAAAEWGRRAAGMSPDDERAMRQLIVLLDQLGDRAGALRAYEEFAARMSQEFQTEPVAETQSLARAVRARVASLSTPDEVSEVVAVGAAGAPQAAIPPPVRSAHRLGRRHGLWITLIGIALAAGVGAALWHRAGGEPVIRAASVIAVLPFAPSGSDSALTRLGRDLVFTVSATLDGVGDIRTVDAHTVLAQAEDLGALSSVRRDAAFGRRFGAGSVVHGSLVRMGDRVRLDLGLFTTDSAASLARATVTAPPESVAALTDSAVRSLLSQIWRRGTPPSPSLDGALRTRSMPALRTFLAGEHALVENRWRDAVTAYDSAIAADSSFWLAYWRDLYARLWGHSEKDSTMVRACRGHRQELPERERMLLECGELLPGGITSGLSRGQAVTSRFPDYWIGWLHYGDMLVHFGPLVGHSRSDARVALEKAVELNPRLVPAWEHLVWMAQQDRDTAVAGRGLRALIGLDAGPRLAEWMDSDELLQFQVVDRLERGDAAGADSLIERAAHGIVANRSDSWIEMDAVLNGFPRAQIALSRAVVRLAPGSEQAAGHRRIIALSWVARGAWDSALTQVDASLTRHPDPSTRIEAYRLAALGAWVGALEVGEARARRPAGRVIEELTASDRGELAWIDGMVAVAEGSYRALAEARTALQRSGDTTGAVLDRSLAAFELRLSSRDRRAADSLAALEWSRAETGYAGEGEHILSMPVNRIAAADWLLTGGDTAQAERLLHWNEAYLSPEPAIVFSGLVALQRARIEQARGLEDEARRHYQDFLSRYDLPTPRHRYLVEEATAAVRHLSDEAQATGKQNR